MPWEPTNKTQCSKYQLWRSNDGFTSLLNPKINGCQADGEGQWLHVDDGSEGMEKWDGNRNLWVTAWAVKEGMGMMEGAATCAGCERWARRKKMEMKEREGKRGTNGREERKRKQRDGEQCHEPVDTGKGGGAREAAAFGAAAATGAGAATRGWNHIDVSALVFSSLSSSFFLSRNLALRAFVFFLFFFLLSGLSPAEKPSPSGTENPCPTSVRCYVLTYINNCLWLTHLYIFNLYLLSMGHKCVEHKLYVSYWRN